MDMRVGAYLNSWLAHANGKFHDSATSGRSILNPNDRVFINNRKNTVMKIISWNVNGLRAVERKGELNRFIDAEKPDVLLVQETKGQPDQFKPFQIAYPDYRQYYNSAEKKGYSGTSAWLHKDIESKIESLEFSGTIPNAPNADEGRLSQLSSRLT